MNEKTKDTVRVISRFTLPTLGVLSLLAVVVAGGGLSLASLMGMLVFYDTTFFLFTFVVGFLVAILGTFQFSRKLFEMAEVKS